ncbi:SUMF1/EgtB/PvdO family nonheme iron enzyme [Promineifilum sp.]|uniref:SUMF1/EgtB/PvdO family nonheme iron enzyme n=1 Tax=Promineifilum sp. TaxID=2664178 RepID=UPI0035ADA3F8
MTLTIGDVLGGRYRIVKLVGQGGFGAVYRAWDTSLHVPVAVKENLDTSPEAQRQFEHEALLLAPLRHPNLPRVSDHFFLPGQGQYLVMDFVEGKSLEQLMAERGGPLPESQAVTWIGQVCDALEYLHTRTPPIIHRDIKPQNIIINAEGRAVLVDFGISKVYDPGLSTTVGARAVTAGYSPPEQYGMGKTDARSDVYALGATLYTLLTSQVPPESVLLIAGHETLRPPHEANPGVSPAVEGAILAAMAVNTSQRLGGAGALRDALAGRAVAPLSPVVRPIAPAPTIPVEMRRGGAPGWVWGAAVLLIVLGAAAFLLLRNRGGEGTQTPEATVASIAEVTITPLAADTPPGETATVVNTVEPAVTKTIGPTPENTPTVDTPPDANRRVISLPGGASVTQLLAPAGSFLMGSDAADNDEDEVPVHPVQLDAFWIDELEVTNALFAAFAADTGHMTTDELDGAGHTVSAATGEFETVDGANWRHPEGPGSDLSGREQQPVALVSWDDARAFCAWAGGRLPTEAEWEYAARGEAALAYPWGESFNVQRVNFCDRNCPLPWSDGEADDGYRFMADVGTFAGGESWVGALDMAGNVWEWTADWYDENYYDYSPADNPQGPPQVVEGGKTVRGGAWSSEAQGVRSAVRVSVAPENGHYDVGIRCVYEVESSEVNGVEVASAGETVVAPDEDIPRVEVPAGAFVRGSTDSDPDALDDEKPQRSINLDSFWIARTETTNRQYAACVAGGGCSPPQNVSSATRERYYGEAGYDDFPVVNVRWNDASAFCRWAEGRLPTEAEWEKAARGPNGSLYPWGDEAPTCARANYNNCVGDTTAAGAYPTGSSVYGALDMAGNVWEWVADWYDGRYYAVAPDANPPGPASGQAHGFRGGAWDDEASLLRAAYRDAYLDQSFSLVYVGFRCAWDSD